MWHAQRLVKNVNRQSRRLIIARSSSSQLRLVHTVCGDARHRTVQRGAARVAAKTPCSAMHMALDKHSVSLNTFARGRHCYAHCVNAVTQRTRPDVNERLLRRIRKQFVNCFLRLTLRLQAVQGYCSVHTVPCDVTRPSSWIASGSVNWLLVRYNQCSAVCLCVCVCVCVCADDDSWPCVISAEPIEMTFLDGTEDRVTCT